MRLLREVHIWCIARYIREVLRARYRSLLRAVHAQPGISEKCSELREVQIRDRYRSLLREVYLKNVHSPEHFSDTCPGRT